MLKRMEIDMNPYTLYPLTNRRSAAIDNPIGVEVSTAVYQAVDAVITGSARLAGAIARWRKRRRAIAELSQLSDHMLKDIGVTRGEIGNRVDGLLDAPKPRSAGPRLVAANAPARSVPTAAANDNVAGGIAA